MSHKRKSNGHEPPTKRQRSLPESGQGILFRPMSASVPALPSISQEHEKAVFTHPSKLGVDDSTNDLKSYDRLELLGDAYIEIIATRLIWETFKTLPTGQMSRIRESLVKNETLGEFTMMYGFDKKLDMIKNPGLTPALWTKIMGDVFEAYVAAVVLSDPIDGFDKAEDWLTKLWEPRLKAVNTTQTNLRSKEELAKTVLASGVKLNYVDERPTIKKGGLSTYFIGVYLTGWGWENQHLGSGKAQNKTAAGNEAAAKALKNHPLIDQIIAKRIEWMEKKEAEKEQKP